MQHHTALSFEPNIVEGTLSWEVSLKAIPKPGQVPKSSITELKSRITKFEQNPKATLNLKHGLMSKDLL